jgi:ABC-2 type transport system ATP-binding protein
LDFFAIPHLARQPISTLSSGQRTLVGIAKAMIHYPDLLVLDEPTASLDPDVADRVQTAIDAFHREHGTTLLLTSHDMAEVERLCDRVLFLQHGAIRADGDSASLAAEFNQVDLTGVFLHVARTTGVAE